MNRAASNLLEAEIESKGEVPASPPYLLSQHDNFLASYAELHNRPFPVLATPLCVSHITLMNDDSAEGPRPLEHLRELCGRYSVNPPSDGDTCFYQSFGEFEVRWEQHFEFCSYTFLVNDCTEIPFQEPPISLIPADWVAQIPGRLVAAVHVEIRDESSSPISRQTMRPWFEGQRLIGSEILAGRATLWSALRLHGDNFNRILVINRSLNECQTGRMLRTVLELETYRNMTLLAFPLARDISSRVTKMERQLSDAIRTMSDVRNTEDERTHLHELSEMAAAIAELIADTRYRFDATHAYHELVRCRLEELSEKEIDELQTVKAFIERRLQPAFRTVEATQRRMDDLARRIDSASEFLRTRVDMSIEEQNHELLKSMSRRVKLQLNLQQTVEGLSVLVISYYMVALVEKVLNGMDLAAVGLEKGLLVTASVPIALGCVWGLSRRWKKRLKALEKESSASDARKR